METKNKKKSSSQRYEIIDKLGSGDFATTFSATDTRLDRQVAIKRLHEQYLEDDEKMSRYWNEAQLLASLEHPNIMTVYDVVRGRGYLVLELMQGSLRKIYAGKPMPVEDVRQTLIQGLQGLQCLHKNSIVHSDINPNNLFLSRQDVVKLGDFGLARRVDDDEGSLIKGTTQFIAPEIVSEEFGKVGPPGDLYSLGFSALNLMVGPDFESLFPDLIAFGRDRKMAWMMWHCSADRKFPPIQSVLEGVPDDMARVIDKLTKKDQNERYHSAQEALDDLSANPAPVGKSLRDEEEAAAAAALALKKKRRKRALLACTASVILSLAIWYFGMPRPEPPPREAPPPLRGVVQNVLTIDQKLVLDTGPDWKEISLRPGDKVILNRLERQLRDLEIGDRVAVHTRLDPDDKSHYELIAFRPATHTGVVQSVDSETSQFVMRVTDGVEAEKEFTLNVPPETPVTLNTLSKSPDDQPLTIAALTAGDRVIVRNSDDEDGMLALDVEAYRDTELTGVIREIELRGRILTVALEKEDAEGESFVKMPLYPDCVFSLNGLASLNNKLIQLKDLRPGDRITMRHDAKARMVDAFRVYDSGGAVAEIDFDAKRIVLNAGNGQQTFAANAETAIALGTEKISFDDLRPNDVLEIAHDSPGESIPVLDQVSVTRPPDTKKWAILIANETFKDDQVRALENPVSNARSLKDRLVRRYAVPDEQAILFENVDQVRLKQEIPSWVSRVPADGELYVYLSTRAFSIPDENVFLAASDSNLKTIEQSGYALDWLLSVLDHCDTKHKALFLDCTHADAEEDPAQLGSDEMIEVVRSTRRGGFPRSVYVFGNAARADADRAVPNPDPALFASSLAEGFAGGADATRDNHIKVTELAKFVESKMAPGSAEISAPVLILPNPTPARISQNAKTMILDLLAQFGSRKLNMEKLQAEADRITKLTNGQPEANLALGVIMLKAARIDPAYEIFEAIRLKHPNYIVAHRCVVWVHFHKLRYDEGLNRLTDMLEQIPKPEDMDGQPYDAKTLAMFEWAGRMRELAGVGDWARRRPSSAELENYDRTMAQFGDKPMQHHNAGREHVKGVIAEFERKIAEDPDSERAYKKERLKLYVDRIADTDVVAEVKEWLDK